MIIQAGLRQRGFVVSRSADKVVPATADIEALFK
jgi:hypothetical protein